MNKISRKTKSAITAVGLSEKSDQNFLKPDAGTLAFCVCEGVHSKITSVVVFASEASLLP